MPSSISSSECPGLPRQTASDRPGVAQPVPERDLPSQPWSTIFVAALATMLALTALWEWHARTLELLPGDLGDGPSAWAEQRHRIDAGNVPVAILGDSRILFDTNLDRFETLTGLRPVQLALPGTNARPFLENLAADPHFNGLAIIGISEISYFRKGLGRFGAALPTFSTSRPRIAFRSASGCSKISLSM